MPKGRQNGTDELKFPPSAWKFTGQIGHPVAIPYFWSCGNAAGLRNEAQL